MRLNDLIAPGAILPLLRVPSKGAALEAMSEAASRVSGLPYAEILDAVLQREELGSTGIGEGIAIPHGKLERCDHIFGVFAHLQKPVAFDAVDGAPVDLLLMLIASDAAGADHLKALARVARFFRDPKTANQLRATRDHDSIYAILSRNGMETHAA